MFFCKSDFRKKCVITFALVICVLAAPRIAYTCQGEDSPSSILLPHVKDLFKRDLYIPGVNDLDVVSHLIKRILQAKQSDAVLVVWDIDNTLLKLESPVGSTEWNGWQWGLLDKFIAGDPNNLTPHLPYLVAPTLPLLHQLNSLLFFLSSTQLIQNNTPHLVSWLKKQGVHVIALTSRGPRDRASTPIHLSNHDMQFADTRIGQHYNPFSNPIDPWSFKFDLNFLSENEKIERRQRDRKVEVLYENGVFYTEGQHKGEMLELLLKVTGHWSSIESVVFIDDSKNQIDNMRTYFSKQSIHTSVIHYTASKDGTRNFNGDMGLQSTVHQEWLSIREKLVQDHWEVESFKHAIGEFNISHFLPR